LTQLVGNMPLPAARFEKQYRQGLDRKNAAFMPLDLSSSLCRPCFSLQFFLVP
jgi:hypothetical protein